MNRFFLVTAIFLITAQRVFCTEAAEGQLGLKTNANEPNFMSIIFALLFVILLIYITGLIYSKLNIIGAKTVREQLNQCDINRAVVLSTTQLGQGKNLHVIEINKKSYLIGATQNSISLLTEIKLSEAKQDTTKIAENIDIDDAIRTLYHGKIEEQNTNIDEIPPEDNFDIHKKYL